MTTGSPSNPPSSKTGVDFWQQLLTSALDPRMSNDCLGIHLRAGLEHLRSVVRNTPELRSIPSAWYRGVLQPGSPNDPPEYDVEMSYGDDQPEGKGWIPLYRSACGCPAPGTSSSTWSPFCPVHAAPPHETNERLPTGLVPTIVCAGCGMEDRPGARHRDWCPTGVGGQLLRPEKTEVGRNHDPSGADRSVGNPDLRAQDQQPLKAPACQHDMTKPNHTLTVHHDMRTEYASVAECTACGTRFNHPLHPENGNGNAKS